VDASWFVELDNFLNNKDHKLKDHPKYVNNYPYKFQDKSFPTVEQAHDLIAKV